MISKEELQDILIDYEACEIGEFSIHTLAFTVATKIIDAQDASVLELLPEKLRLGVLNIAEAYKRDGAVVSQSSIGSSTHTELGARLASLLDAYFGSKND